MKDQINKHLSDRRLLADVQSGFRSHHGTASAILKITDDIRLRTDKKLVTALVLLDFSKAFDTVNHSVLCDKLSRNFYFASSSARLICSYLTNRRQCVDFNGMVSGFLDSDCGVPQGSILGPLLFSLYINDLPSVLSFSEVHLYADDCQIYCSSHTSDVNSLIQSINSDLGRIQVWASINGLSLNAKKSQALIINNKLNIPIPDIVLNHEVIVPTATVKNLGVILNNQLTWFDHIVCATKKIYGILACLWRSVTFTPRSIRKKLVISLCIPVITYCDAAFSGMDSYCWQKLQLCFNSCVRYVFRLRKYDHISQFENAILGCSLRQYLDFRLLVFLFKIIHHKQPHYLFSKLIFSRSKRKLNINPTPHSTRQYSTSFFIKAVGLWNNLPSHLQRAITLKSFKKECFNWVLSR